MRKPRRIGCIGPIALSAILCAAFLWPKHDPYDFLRKFHPVERLSEAKTGIAGGHPVYMKAINFTVPEADVRRVLEAHWQPDNRNPSYEDLPGTKSYLNANGQSFLFIYSNQVMNLDPGVTCSVWAWNVKPNWFERQAATIKAWLGIKD